MAPRPLGTLGIADIRGSELTSLWVGCTLVSVERSWRRRGVLLSGRQRPGRLHAILFSEASA